MTISVSQNNEKKKKSNRTKKTKMEKAHQKRMNDVNTKIVRAF